jgi:hypothetical protein
MRGAGCQMSRPIITHLGPAPLHVDCMVTSVHGENGEILSNAKTLWQGRAAEDGYQYKLKIMDLSTRNSFNYLKYYIRTGIPVPVLTLHPSRHLQCLINNNE